MVEELIDGINEYALYARRRCVLAAEWEIEPPTKRPAIATSSLEDLRPLLKTALKCLDWLVPSDFLTEFLLSNTSAEATREILFGKSHPCDIIFFSGPEMGSPNARIHQGADIELSCEDDGRYLIDLVLFGNVYTPEVYVVASGLLQKRGTARFSYESERNREWLNSSFACLRANGFLISPITSDQIEGIVATGISERAALR